jgi:hypothetical protein
LFNPKIKIMKLSLDALKEKAGSVVTEKLLGEISGGTQAACHPQLVKKLQEAYIKY